MRKERERDLRAGLTGRKNRIAVPTKDDGERCAPQGLDGTATLETTLTCHPCAAQHSGGRMGPRRWTQAPQRWSACSPGDQALSLTPSTSAVGAKFLTSMMVQAAALERQHGALPSSRFKYLMLGPALPTCTR
jgi:hypothetical protein